MDENMKCEMCHHEHAAGTPCTAMKEDGAPCTCGHMDAAPMA